MFGFGNYLSTGTDVISVLTADHRKVDALFAELEAAERGPRKIALATRICHELVVHATAEEQIFYPQVLAALQLEGSKDVELIWEATVEHGTLEGLIDSLTGMSASDDDFDAHMKVLREYVKHHVKEEENQIFPRARRTSLDLEAMGEAITERKLALEAAMSRDLAGGRPADGKRGRGGEARRAERAGGSKQDGSGEKSGARGELRAGGRARTRSAAR